MGGFTRGERPLLHVVAFCLLGGFSVRAEINDAAFQSILVAGLLEPDCVATADIFEARLSVPLRVGERQVRYRFPRQRAKRLATALSILKADPPPTDNVHVFRRHLMQIQGIGPKTASWIARDWLASDEVAILDVHVVRACQLMNLFPQHIRLPKDYDQLEQRFIQFANALGVRASILDSVIWNEMREFSRL